jgi:Tfp pilus assembly protein PilF
VTLVLAALLAAAAQAPPEQRFASATLANGATIAFALVRPGAAGAAGIAEAALPRSNSVSRVLWDKQTGVYFGYQIAVTRQQGARPFKVEVRALERAAVERELKQRGDCAGCPPPSPLGAARTQFPPVQQLVEGDALTLELLTNPATGERIFDVVKVSAQPLSAPDMQAAVSRAVLGQEAVSRGAALAAREQFSAAADQYRIALEVQPNDAALRNKLGMCYQQLHNDPAARREYEKALEIDPAYAEAWNNLGTLDQARKSFRRAVRSYQKAIEIKPGLATPWKNLGNAFLALGQVDDAFVAYQEAFRLNPTVLQNQDQGVPAAGIDAATQAYYIAKMLAQTGQKDAAIEFLRRAREFGFRDFGKVAADADFRTVVADPRYKEIVAQ